MCKLIIFYLKNKKKIRSKIVFKSLSLSLTINGFVDVTLSYVNTKYVCMRTIVEYFLLTLVDLAPCGGLLYRHGLHALVPIHRIHS